MYNHPTPPHTSLHHTHHPTPPHTSSNSTIHLIQLHHTPHPTPPYTSSNSTIHLTSSLHLLLSVTYNYIFLVYYCGKYCFSCNNKISNIALDSKLHITSACINDFYTCTMHLQTFNMTNFIMKFCYIIYSFYWNFYVFKTSTNKLANTEYT